ncbi:FAD-binding protein [Candidatus Hydrogenedentota bacterium]
MKEMTCDVMVIGGGGAGTRAAIEAFESGDSKNVLLVTKGELGKSGCTALSCSDRMAFHATLPYTEPGGDDNWTYHADDVYRIGGYVSDETLARVLAKNAGEAYEYLNGLGVPWAKKDDGKADQFVTDGSDYARACYTGPYTANDIEAALVRRFKELDIPLLENTMVAELLLSEDGRVAGALAISQAGDEQVLIKAKATVIATGGGGSAFRVNVFPEQMSGDGTAMAYRAGAELVNMELIQIGLSSVKTKLACSGSMMRSIPRVVNTKDEEFLAGYFPEGTSLTHIYNIVFRKGASWPVSCEEESSALDVAISKEMLKGETVYLDYASNPKDFDFEALSDETKSRYQDEMTSDIGLADRQASPLNRLTEINVPAIQWLKERGIDLEKGDKIELAPAIQHFQGGIKLAENAASSIPGLYAAGEAAGGQHGANRPGGNALMDCQVFGKIAGHEAAAEAAQIEQPNISEESLQAAIAGLDALSVGGAPAAEVREKVQGLLASAGAVIRTEDNIAKTLAAIKDLKAKGMKLDDNGIAFALEAKNMFDVAETVLTACGMRKESRGPHLFFNSVDDAKPLPRDEENWNTYIVIKKTDEGLTTEVRKPATVG